MSGSSGPGHAPRRPAGALWRRIVIAVVGVTAITTLGAGIIAWFTTRALVLQSIDGQLQERAAFFQRGVPDGLISGRYPTSSGDSQDLVQIVENDTSLWRSSGLSDGQDLAACGFGENAGTGVLADGTAVRGLLFPAPVRYRRWRDDDRPAPPERIVTVIMARDLTPVLEELHRLAYVLAGIWILATGLAAFAAYSVKSAIMRPVRQLATAIAAIDPATLTPRVDPTQAPAELAVVAEHLGTLLQRVDAVLSREKATIGHIAHELRTPVAGLRTTLEFAIARGGDHPALATHRTCLGVVEGMQTQIETLLTLTRLEAGTEPILPTDVDLAALLRTCWNERAADIATRRVHAAWALREPLTIHSGAAQLAAIMRNLIGNAVDHSPEGALITIDGGIDDAGIEVRLTNPSDLTDLEHIFTPFWRADAARSTGHSGLGLALCQRLVRVLGGTISAKADGSTFTIVVRLPRNAPMVPGSQ